MTLGEIMNESIKLSSKDVNDIEKHMDMYNRGKLDAEEVLSVIDEIIFGRPAAPGFKESAVNEAKYLDKLSGKELAKRMLKNKIFKPFAQEFAKMKIVTHADLQDTLPDWVPGKEIQMLFSESVNEGASTEEKRIVMMAVRKLAKYRGVSIEMAMNDLLRAADDVDRDIQKGKIKK